MKISQTYKNIFVLVAVAGSFFLITKTLAVSNPFRPGETRDPACAPGDPFCTVTLEKDLYKENAMGVITNVTSGTNSIAIGSGITASGNYSIAIGHEDADEFLLGPTASNSYSISIGNQSVASGIYSIALGGGVASGTNSLSTGIDSQASGLGSISIGTGTRSPSFREVSLGSYPEIYTPESATSWSSEDRIFSVGVGENGANRKNALTVFKNGQVEMAQTLTLKNGGLILEDNLFELGETFNSTISFSGGNITMSDGALNVGRGGLVFQNRRQEVGAVKIDSFALDARNRTDAIILPQGGDSERPQEAPSGAIRYNTDSNNIEITKGADNWVAVGGDSSPLIDTITDLSSAEDTPPSADGQNSIALGLGTRTSSKGEIAIGTYNLPTDDYGGGDFSIDNVAISIGRGYTNGGSTKSENAFIALRNGQIGLGSISQNDLLSASGVSILTDTGAFLSSDGTWTNASDEKLKNNIQDLRYGLDEVLDLEPRSFTFEKSGRESIGFIAQEIETVIPEIVSNSGLGTKGVEYGQLTAVLVNAIKELENRVAYLESSTGQKSPNMIIQENNNEKEETIEINEPEQEQPEGQQASIISSSNEMNLTNILLILAVALLFMNLAIISRREKINS